MLCPNGTPWRPRLAVVGTSASFASLSQAPPLPILLPLSPPLRRPAPPPSLLPLCDSALCLVLFPRAPLTNLGPVAPAPILPYLPRPLPIPPPVIFGCSFSFVSAAVCIRWFQRRPDHRAVDVSPYSDPHRTTIWPILFFLVPHPSLFIHQYLPCRSAQHASGHPSRRRCGRRHPRTAQGAATHEQPRAVPACVGFDRYTYSDASFSTLPGSSCELEREY